MADLGKGAWFAHTAPLLFLVLKHYDWVFNYIDHVLFFFSSAESLPHLVGGAQ